VQLRFAAFKTVKPPLIADRTIQPTQVAGFNQFFDDANGTEGWLYGAGLDINVTKTVDAGVEAYTRSFSEPARQSDEDERVARVNRHEDLYRAYVYWTPYLEWAVTGEFQYDRYETQLSDTAFPKEVTSSAAPLSVSYFSPLGLFGDLSGTLVHQDVVYRSATANQDGDSTFFVVDATIGFRLPERRGLLSFQVRNLFDTRTQFEDDTYREFRDAFSRDNQPSALAYIPERTFLFGITINL
jgi:hypothetical protein